MDNTRIDQFIDLACKQVMVGAAEYIKQYADGAVITDGLMNALKVATKDVWDAAIADAREAIECGMGAYAATTFSSSMRLAGYQAAEQYLSA